MQAQAAFSKLLLIGHRGARLYAPENTFFSFDLALEHGCDGLEFDVRRTADGHAVVCHDERYLGLQVEASSYDVLAHNASLPRLEDVVRTYGAKAFLYIELKVGGLECEIARVLRDHPPVCGHVVASFLPGVLRAMHETDPAIPLGLIAGNRSQLDLWPELPVGYVMPQSAFISRWLTEDLHAAGKRVLVWTVNSARLMREVAAMGVDGILSDDTNLLCRTLRRPVA